MRPALGTEDLSEELVIEGNQVRFHLRARTSFFPSSCVTLNQVSLTFPSQVVVKQKKARFDHVLGPAVTQEEVFNRIVRPQVK